MISENIRETIKNMINKAKGNLNMPQEIEHMIVQISYEMYKAGLKDGHDIGIKFLQISKKELDK